MKRAITLAALFAAGCAAALTIGASQANAWDWNSLPSGYSVGSYQTCYDDQGHNHMPNCGAIPICNHLSISSSAGTFTEADCVETFAADLDAFINSTICTVNPAAGGQACAPQTTAATTTATGTTTTAPTTTSTETTPATTTAPPAATDDHLTQQIDQLAAQVAALTAQIAALTTRVDRLELAGDAASLAFEQAVEQGMSVADAAQLARGTYLNAVNGLGAFA